MTLIELLIVSTILGILTSIATPSYLGFRDSANKAAASANVAAIVPDVEWYAFDNYPGSPTTRDPDYNGSDAAYTGTNADSGYSDSGGRLPHAVAVEVRHVDLDQQLHVGSDWLGACGRPYNRERLLPLHGGGLVVQREARPERRHHQGADDAPWRQRRLLRVVKQPAAVADR